MGSGVSTLDLNQVALEDVINKVKELPEEERLDGEQVEAVVGLDLFDPNHYDALATFDIETGLHTVQQQDLLKLLLAQQIITDPNLEATTINEFEEQEELKRFRNSILSKEVPASEVCEMRGAVWPQYAAPPSTYNPIPPVDADSRTKVFPYASAGVFILQQRPGGGWNLGVFRNSTTGEWGIPSANFTERHRISQSRSNALRACVAQSLYEQSCGLLQCSPQSIGHVLRDDCAVSVSFDGADKLDEHGKPRHLMQLFVMRVEGISSEEFQLNRSIVLRNLAGSIPKRSWLEMDDFTLINTQDLKKTNSNFTVADINGRMCSCRRLINILNREVVPAIETSSYNGPVLLELIMRFEYLLFKFNESQKNGKNKKDSAKFSYFEKRWFGRNDDDSDVNERQVTENVELKFHPELEGGVLAGGYTASLSSSASLLYKLK